MNQYKPRMLRKPTQDEAEEPFIALSPIVLAGEGARRAAGPAPASAGPAPQPAQIERRLAELKATNDRLRARIERLQAANAPTRPAS